MITVEIAITLKCPAQGHDECNGDFSTVRGVYAQTVTLFQTCALLMNLGEHIIKCAREKQDFFLDYSCAGMRDSNLWVGMLAGKVRVGPEIAGIPRESCHYPVVVRGHGC